MKKTVLVCLIPSLFRLILSGGISPAFSAPSALQEKDKISDLPVVITREKAKTNTTTLALVISGDGGWFYFEQKIADQLAALGIPTLGLDSRKYFWSRKTPDETAADMSALFSHYCREWGRPKIILIGYSLGAEIVPFIVNRLPSAMRSEVFSTLLLSPDISTDFEIHISNMLGMGNPQNTFDVVKEIRNMKNVPTLIIFGDGEKTKVPGLLSGSAAKIRVIPGDHHYKFNVTLILRTMRENKVL